jgi:hypothetical protein
VVELNNPMPGISQFGRQVIITLYGPLLVRCTALEDRNVRLQHYEPVPKSFRCRPLVRMKIEFSRDGFEVVVPNPSTRALLVVDTVATVERHPLYIGPLLIPRAADVRIVVENRL